MRKTLFALAAATWCACAVARPYIVVDLGPLPAGFDPGGDHAPTINSRGQVSGSLAGDHPVAAIATAGDGAKAIVPPALFSEAGAINESGNAVGILVPSGSPESTFRAFFYNGGSLLDMGTLGGVSAFAIRLSNTNLATGNSEDASGVARAFLWNGSSMIGLPMPPGASESVGEGVSDNGKVTGLVGFGANPGSNYQAFVWKGAEMILLAGGLFSDGEAVNNDGVVVGSSDFGAGIGFQATMWTASGTRVNLGVGEPFSEALAINNVGVIAGYTEIQSDSFGGPHAYVWNRGTATDLGGLLPPAVGSIAWSINDLGAVFGLTYSNAPSNEVIEWAPSVPIALVALQRQVAGVGPGRSLTNKVLAALVSYVLNDTRGTCGVLRGFVNEVKAQDGKKIDPAVATRLLGNAGAIEAAIGCR